MTTPRITFVVPGRDDDLAFRLQQLQREAYRVEAALIGDDRIPPLHETLAELRAAPLQWLAATGPDGLVGAVAWTAAPEGLDVDRLVVAPSAHRRGVGTALLAAVLDRAAGRPTTVSTGRANAPARALYTRTGFVELGHREVLPGLWTTQLVHPGRCPAG